MARSEDHDLLATDLSHDSHQSQRANVGTLATHIAASDDMQSRLLCSIDIVWNKFGLHDLFFDRMAASFDGQCVRKLRLR
jgi:hypothetical protein